MIPLFIGFFFIIYICLENCKYINGGVVSAIKKKQKRYNYKVCLLKLIVICLDGILLIVNRLLPSAILEKSTGLQGLLVLLFFLFIFIVCSVIDFLKARKEKDLYEEE